LRRKPGGARPINTTSFSKGYGRLADHRGSGAPRPALGQNIRIGIVTPFVVIYRNDDSGTVTVLRIVHGRRRITGRMLGSA
jgi:toxin ParE1/3/4